MTGKLHWYTIQLDYYPTASGSSVAALALATTILKVTDIMRGTLIKLIFIEKANQFYNFTVFPGATCVGQPGAQSCMPKFTLNIRAVTTS